MRYISKIWNSKLWLVLMVIFLAVLNKFASVYHSRIDLTAEKRFTLSTPSIKLLKQLDDVVEVKIFLKGDFPSGFKKLANSSADILREFREIAGARFQYSFISPEEMMDGTSVKWADTLSGMGLYPINLKSQLKQGEQQQLIYPVALMRYKDNVLPVRLYNGIPNIGFREINSAEALMEYQLASGLYKLTAGVKSMIAYSIGNGEPQDARAYDLVENVISGNYNLKLINLNTVPLIEDTFKLLMIVKPTQPYTENEKLKIDQFVMRGGKLLVFTDKLNAEMDSLRIKNEVIAYDRALALDDLFFRYGVRINNDLIMDLQCDRLPFDVNGNSQFEFLPWNYFPVFVSKSNHPINKNLGFVSGKFVNSIDTVESEGISKTVLISSSPNARTISAPALISGSQNINAPEDEKFKKADIPAAVLLEGKFQSLYRNRLSKEMSDSLEKYNQNFLSSNIFDNKIIIAADGDLVLNDVVKGEPLAMGMNPFTYGSQYAYSFANRDFLENCLEYLIDPSGLSVAKSKDYTLRLLDAKKMADQKTKWQVLNIFLPLLVVFIFAVFFTWMRKLKYRK